jgi:hypothetical protein
VLRAFVLVYAKSIDLAYTELAKGHVRNGEDILLDHYGIAVQMEDPVEDVLDVVHLALNWLKSESESGYDYLAILIPVEEIWRIGMMERLICRSVGANARLADARTISSRSTQPATLGQSFSRVCTAKTLDS